MAFKVRVSADVAAQRGGKGTRRRGGHEWSRQWQMVDALPDGVADDPHLEVVEVKKEKGKEVKAEKPKAAASGAGKQRAATGDLPPIPDDLSTLSWPKLQKLGGDHGVTGKKKEIVAGLEKKRAAAAATAELRPERLGDQAKASSTPNPTAPTE